VMLSASTARLVDGAAVLGEPELVHIKGADEPVAAHRLFGMGDQHRALLEKVREDIHRERFSHAMSGVIDMHVAKEKARSGDLDGAIELSGTIVDDRVDSGEVGWAVLATVVLVEALLRRRAEGDLQQAQAAIDRLADVPTEPGMVVFELWPLRWRALLARAHGDEAAYRDYRDRYRAMARSLEFEGHMKWAEAMP
jgi:adenylate cyclase